MLGIWAWYIRRRRSVEKHNREVPAGSRGRRSCRAHVAASGDRPLALRRLRRLCARLSGATGTYGPGTDQRQGEPGQRRRLHRTRRLSHGLSGRCDLAGLRFRAARRRDSDADARSSKPACPGIFIAGELGGMGLIRNALEQGRQAVDVIAARGKPSPDQALLDLVIVGAGPAGFSASLAAKAHAPSLRDARAGVARWLRVPVSARQGRDDGASGAAAGRQGPIPQHQQGGAAGLLAGSRTQDRCRDPLPASRRGHHAHRRGVSS